MRKVVKTAVSPDGKFRLTIFDDNTARRDRLCTAKIINLNQEEPQTNVNGTVFYVATVEADFGDGNKATGPAIIWHNQLTSDKLSPDTFKAGATVGLAIQIKSEFAGNASIEVWPKDRIEQLQVNNPIEENTTDFDVNEETPNQEDSNFQDENDFNEMVEFFTLKKDSFKKSLIFALENSWVFEEEPSSERDLVISDNIFKYSNQLRSELLNMEGFDYELCIENDYYKEKYIEETCSKFIKELQEYFFIV